MERHHTLWTRKEFYTSSPLSKQVRQCSAFIIEVYQPNHRLLHARMKPPQVPDHATLLEMRELSFRGINHVIDNLNHPIAEHLEHQLQVITLNPEVALRMVETGMYHIPLRR